MAGLSIYNIKLLSLSQGEYSFEYDLDDKFFHDVDGDEVKKGDVKATIKLVVTSSTYDFIFDLKGFVEISCNRCLDDMKQLIDTKNRLVVKLGEEYVEESDEVIIVPRDEGVMNISWFLYEFIALSIPIMHYHEPGKCNELMSSKLREHQAISDYDELDVLDDDETAEDTSEDENIDPRWNALKGLRFEE